MYITNTTHEICINRKNEVWTNVRGNWEKIEGSEESIFRRVHQICNKRTLSNSAKFAMVDRQLKRIGIDIEKASVKSSVDTSSVDRLEVKTTIQKIIDFFSEFQFEPNFRFINSFAYACKISSTSAKDYINNYFALTDSQFSEAISEKIKSSEFTAIVSSLKSIPISKKVNNRFKLYYGSQGTGKTTAAMKETDANCMVCHSAMLPSDLMEDFKFIDGKATFVPSALQDAIVGGYSITLDEINLLPFESLRFLQSILDGKTQFEYKGKTIVVKDGFKIIGTMNLMVNGNVYALPEPLVDRAEELRCYKLTAEQLVGALI